MLVVVIVTMVAILATIVLVIGLFNYQMKVTNRGTKENFYDAEQVLDEICLGLQQDVSEAMSEAYVDTCSNYDTENVFESTRYFNEVYLTGVKGRVASAGNTSYYDMNHLLGFLDENVKKNTTLTTSKGRNPILSVSNKGLILKNLYLTYVNEENYVSRVATDIHIKIPDINFSNALSVPRLLQYSIVANKGIVVESGTGTVTFNGNVYAGSTGDTNPEFWVKSGKTVNIAAGRTLIVEDAIKIAGGTLNQEKEGELWAKDITVQNKGTVQLAGKSYVENDLTLLGGSLNISGEYYGFGNPKAALQSESVKELGLQSDIEENPADYSSAVIVNGVTSWSNSTLNLTSLDMLMLAGNAYVGNSEVIMGESLTVKSNQIAYLVPDSCMMGRSNPLPAETRNAVIGITDSDTEEDIKTKENAFKGQLLFRVQTGISSEVEDIVQMTDKKGFYYYYMKFKNVKAANQYFSSYMESADSKKLKDSLNFYVGEQEVKINKNVDKAVNGNILVYDENGISVIGDTIEEGAQEITQNSDIMEQLVNCYDIFNALNTNLTRDYESITGTQKSRESVYANVFDEKTFFHRVAPCVMLSYRVGDKVYAGWCGGTGYGNYGTVSGLKRIFKGQFGKNAEACLVIAYGDFTIDEDFDGLIICKGKVTIKSKSTEEPNIQIGTANPMGIVGVMDDVFHPMASLENVQSDRIDEEYTMKDFMYGSDVYLGKFYETESRMDNHIDLEDLVVYENWSKQ